MEGVLRPQSARSHLEYGEKEAVVMVENQAEYV
jgi:hypothetical protein